MVCMWIYMVVILIDMIDLLLSNGADINASANNGVTPLTMACVSNKLDVAQYLSQKGASSTTQMYNQVTIFSDNVELLKQKESILFIC